MITNTLRISTISIAIIAMAPFLAAQTGAPSMKNSRAVKKKLEPSASKTEVQNLKEILMMQQRQLDQQSQQVEQLRSELQQVVDAAHQAASAAQNVQSRVEQAQTTASQAEQSAADARRAAEQASSSSKETQEEASLLAKQTEASLLAKQTKDEGRQLTTLEAMAGRFRLNGDVRVRGESYNQNAVPDRNRARIRVRFGVDSQLNQDFFAGVAVATGSLGDPSSTNETLTNVFDRKTIALDRGFITYNPAAHNWLSLTGGKFAYTWLRTSATFDPDLNPEGFNQKFSFNFSGPLQNFTIQGIELLYNESTAAQDSYALGGQVSAKFKLGPWTATPSFLSLKWNRPDGILQQSAFATQATTTGTSSAGPFPISGEGQGCAKGLGFPAYAPCAFAPNGMTNATFTDAKGVPHFFSGYNYADFILNNQIQTPAKRLPINLLLEFEDNLDAEHHPLNSKGTVAANLGSQNKEYGGDLNLGQTKNKNDVQFGYGWYREEQDAAISSFVESDQRAPTNILQNRIYTSWKVRSNTLANFTWWRGRTLNTNLENNAALYNNWSTANKSTTITAAGQKEPYLNRLQFDLIYTY